ncbi:hypothetical protein ACTFIV_002849 [Dictyostelium citrinum]
MYSIYTNNFNIINLKKPNKLLSLNKIIFISILIISLIIPINQSQRINTEEIGNEKISIRPKLKFNKNGKFKIVQFTDLHYGEADEYDLLNLIVQENIIEHELPDFVMLSGDMFSAYNIRTSEKYLTLWEMVTRSMRKRNIPWSITFGNHDCEGPLSGREIVKMDQSFSNLSLTQENIDPNVPGITNYKLEIYSSLIDENSNSNDYNMDLSISSSIFIFDSDLPQCNESGSWGCINEKQVEWYEKESDQQGNIPSIAFVHIPPVEVIDLWNENVVRGDFGDKESCCYYTDESEFVSTMIERGDIKGLYFGHDHKNDFHGIYQNSIELGYGRKSGYGSYNPKYLEGARIIELTEQPFSIKTWIRNVNGELETQQTHYPNSYSQSPRYCCTHEDHKDESSWTLFLIGYCSTVILVSIVFYIKRSKSNQNQSYNVIEL